MAELWADNFSNNALFRGLKLDPAESLKLTYEKLLARFKIYRFLYIDESPDKLVEMSDPNFYFYKCRGNFFTAIQGYLELMQELGLVLDNDVNREIVEFFFVVQQLPITNRILKENIDSANHILDILIVYISAQLHSLSDKI